MQGSQKMPERVALRSILVIVLDVVVIGALVVTRGDR
jgi:hypothetical protein